MDDEIAHAGVVDGALRRALPGVVGGFVVRIGADEIDVGEIRELRPVERFNSPPITRCSNCRSSLMGEILSRMAACAARSGAANGEIIDHQARDMQRAAPFSVRAGDEARIHVQHLPATVTSLTG